MPRQSRHFLLAGLGLTLCRHCTRTSAAQARRRERSYLQRAAKVKGFTFAPHLTNSEEIHLDIPFPDHFLKFNKSSKSVTDLAAKLWTTPPEELPKITEDDRLTLLIKTNPPTDAQLKQMGPGGVGGWLARDFKGKERDVLSNQEWAALEADGMPRYLAMRFARLIPLDILDALLHAWQVMIDLGVRFPATELQRSGSLALYLAIWLVHGNGIRISGDSLQNYLAKLKDQTQHTAVITAMDLPFDLTWFFVLIGWPPVAT
ncbi:hypothetical protein B0H14DRAFT_3631944 [Mycena olivaceomarginata]|nr:hypothetical protein B0H14DRAFT_3631944 [Mycena olivaceomarginata]